MPDPLTTIVVAAGGAIASKEILNKLLGPTAEYLGEGARDLMEKAAENMGRVFQASYAKLKGQLEEVGQVNPRVLKNVWDEGRFVEDVLSAEYFGGLLASARTEDGRDDTALPMVALATSLSADQLRLHFIIYSVLAKYPFDFDTTKSRRSWHGLEVRIPADDLVSAMECGGADKEARLLLALNGLIDNRLIGEHHAFRMGGVTANNGKSLKEDGLLVCPNERGASLFLRALGSRGLHPELITTINVDYSLSDTVKAAVKLPSNASCRYRNLPDEFALLQSELADQLSDFQSALDDVKDDVDELKDKTEHDDGGTTGEGDNLHL